MKTKLLLFALILSSLTSLGAENHEKNENQEKAPSNDLFKKLKQKNYPDNLIVALLHEATPEQIDHVDFRRSMWVHNNLILISKELAEEINPPKAENSVSEIELNLSKGVSAYEVYDSILCRAAWHTKGVKDNKITINCYHRPHDESLLNAKNKQGVPQIANHQIMSLFEKIKQKTYPDGYKKKGYPDNLIVALLHEAAPEQIDHIDFRRSMWVHRLGLTLTKQLNLPVKESKKEIELDLPKGASADDVLRVISLSTGWHIAEVNNKIVTINCHHRPQIDK